jgi:hypothetical protein
MIIIKAPAEPYGTSYPRIFLAGSIEMGMADNWQDRLADALKLYQGTLLNPRRDNWDSTWEQKASNPQFSEQVNWELDHIEASDLVLMYFDPNTKSPITLLELGLLANRKRTNLIVCCPDGFWRKGNVEIVCNRHAIKLLNTFDELINSTIEYCRSTHDFYVNENKIW